MTIAASVQKHLIREGVSYELIEHARALDSTHSAQAAHVLGAQLAKGTVLKDDQGFIIAVVPATRKVDLGAMHRRFGRLFGLARMRTEREGRGGAFADSGVRVGGDNPRLLDVRRLDRTDRD